jgi:hypothetical protein
MADRVDQTPEDIRAQHVFEVLAKEFEKHLRWGGIGEKCTVEFFVYDSTKLAMRPVLGYASGGLTPSWRDFLVPLGDGIAGAAFQQRSILPWAKDTIGSVFTKPVINDHADVETRALLAVPVYHPAQQDERRPSPWATIGVVSFGSSSLASKVPALLNSTLSTENAKMLTILRGLAQAHVHDILTTLGHPEP